MGYLESISISITSYTLKIVFVFVSVIYIYVHVFLSCLIHNFHTYGHMDKGNELQVRFPSSESLISQVVHGTRFLGV